MMGDVAGSLTLERVRQDIDVLSRAGLDTATFVNEVDASLQRAVPFRASCVAMVDPASLLLTGTFKFGELYGNDTKDHEWGLIEYSLEEDSCFADLAVREVPAMAMQLQTGGDTHRSARMRELIHPHFGYSDELRLVARHGHQAWGGLALFRAAGDPAFTDTEVAYLAALSPVIALGLRSGLLARLSADAGSRGGESWPAVVIVGSDDTVQQLSVGAEHVLRDLAAGPNMADASGIVGALVAGARRYGAGLAPSLPQARVRLHSGRWLVLHASPLAGLGRASSDVVITMEEARPPEIVPLVVAAFDLTPRERDVAQLVLQGVETKEIAATLHMSRYTVQDHLKSIFEKADVRSRRELIARVFFDQYLPRMGGDLTPSGWFAET
jgi:DNA-binding CsgD family transcriptional regulator